MSRHYELMQQIEKEREPAVPAGGDILGSLAAAHGQHGNGAEAAGRWASEEALRLVQQVFLVQASDPPRAVVFAAIDHGNGCSRIAAGVAETLAANNRGRVCLVEANFRSPGLPGMFGMSNHFGLTEALTGDGPVGAFARPAGRDRLWLLSSGTLDTGSPSLLAGDGMRARLAELRKQFDFVLIDAPPLNRYSDALALGQLADGLVLVLEAGATRREPAAAAAGTLRAAGVPILAAVLNKRTFPIPETIYNRL